MEWGLDDVCCSILPRTRSDTHKSVLVRHPFSPPKVDVDPSEPRGAIAAAGREGESEIGERERARERAERAKGHGKIAGDLR